MKVIDAIRRWWRDRHEHDYELLPVRCDDTYYRFRCRVCGRIIEDK